MTSADRNRIAISRSATSRARRPAIVVPTTGEAGVLAALRAIKEHLELMQGARGNPWEEVITKRDLEEMGIRRVVFAGTAAGSVMIQDPAGVYRPLPMDAFAEMLRNTRLYRDLMKRLDDDSRFDGLPDQIKTLLLADLHQIAAQRGADIQRLESRLQSETQSLAYQITEVTAALGQSTAAVRQTLFAYADQNRASSGAITQVVASLAGAAGLDGTAGVEEVMLAVADLFAGLLAQYTLKVNAGGAYAAIGLSATSNLAGEEDSHIIFVANNFAFVHPDDVIGTGPGEVDPANPGANRIPFGIDSAGVIYLNGQVRINALGQTLDDLAAATGIYISATSSFWKVDSLGAAVNSSITLTANFTDGLSGFVDWSKSGTGTAAPTAGTTNTWVISAADQVDDTVTYTASFVDGATTYEDSITVVRLRDGSTALTGLLTNESHTVPASSAGVVSSFAGAGGVFAVYQGATDITTSCTFAIQDNPDSLTASIGAATGIFSVTAAGSWAGATPTTTLTLRATYGSTTIDKVFTLTKAASGATGADATAYWLARSAGAISKDLAGAYTPSSVTFSAYSAAGTGSPAAYAGRFIIATSADGSSYTTRYTSGSNESSKAYTVPAGIVTIRVRLYLAGGTSTLLDEEILSVVTDGDSGVAGITHALSNAAHTVPASATGTVSSYTGSGTTIQVYEGSTALTFHTTLAASRFTIGTPTVAPSSAITVGARSGSGTTTATVAQHSAMSGAQDTATITYPITARRADGTDVTFSLVQTITKSKAGTDGAAGDAGAAGARGSLTAYGTPYALYLNGTGDDTDPWPSSGTTAQKTNHERANRLIHNVLNGAVLTTNLASTTHLVLGDTVTMTNVGATAVQTRYWSGTAWVKPGVIIDGNLLVNGTVSADVINAGTLTGVDIDLGPGAEFQVDGTTGVVSITKPIILNGTAGNTFNPALPAFKASSATSTSAATMEASTHASNSSGFAHAFRGVNNFDGSSGLVGSAASFDFYAEGAAANYGPFTGAHEGVVANGTVIEPGDIVVDVRCVARKNLSNTVFEIAASSIPNQKAVVGVMVKDCGPLALREPAAFVDSVAYEVVQPHRPAKGRMKERAEVTRRVPRMAQSHRDLGATHTLVVFNALGEGQINICGLGGDLEAGDLIVTSAMPGKGMRADPDMPLTAGNFGTIVAKTREAVTFTHPGQVKTVACIYLCG